MNRNVLIFILTLLLTVSAGINIRAEVNNITRENLKKDIMILKEELPKKHINIANTVSKADFKNSLQQLYDQADTMEVDRIFSITKY
jgi:hypothetical protein